MNSHCHDVVGIFLVEHVEAHDATRTPATPCTRELLDEHFLLGSLGKRHEIALRRGNAVFVGLAIHLMDGNGALRTT